MFNSTPDVTLGLLWLGGWRDATCRYLTILVFSFASAIAPACSCARTDTPIEDQVSALFEAHEIVGVFEVTGAFSGRKTYEGRSQSRRWLKLESRRMFKGSNATLFARAVPLLFRTSCDVSFKKGAIILVYASSDRPVELRWCAWSGSIVQRFEHLPVLFTLSDEWR